MDWLVLVLLALALIFVPGLVRLFVALLVMGFGIAILGRGDQERMMTWLLWCIGVAVWFGILAVFKDPKTKDCPYCDEEVKYRATVCKHCGSNLPALEPRPRMTFNTEAVLREFRLPDWGSLSVKDYLGAGALALGVAAIGFFTLYFLTLQ